MFAGAGEALGAAERDVLASALAEGLARVFAVLALLGFLTLVAAWLVPKRSVWTRVEARGGA